MTTSPKFCHPERSEVRFSIAPFCDEALFVLGVSPLYKNGVIPSAVRHGFPSPLFTSNLLFRGQAPNHPLSNALSCPHSTTNRSATR